MITVQLLRECFDYDESTGSLVWRERPMHHFGDSRACNSWNYRYAGGEAGGFGSHGYKQCHLVGKIIKVHTICWALAHGEIPKHDIDHIDRNRANNALSNLRQCTRAENSRNRASKNSLGLKGIRRSGLKFTAQICINYKKMHLGTFATPEEAHQAYCKAATELHGEFANHNIEG